MATPTSAPTRSPAVDGNDPAAPVPANPSTPGKLVLFGKRIASRPGVKHIIAAVGRYNERLGSQFAGAMTYFSFLSLVPILMVAFSVGGIVLRNNPDLLERVEKQITDVLPAGGLAQGIKDVIDGVVANPLGVGLVGLAVALYSGIGWMSNLRKAMQAMWRKRFDEDPAAADSFVKALLKDLGALAGLAVAIVVSVGISGFATQGQKLILDLFGLSDDSWLGPVVTVTTLLIAMAADVVIFLWVFTVIPGRRLRRPFKPRLRGAIIAAVGFELMKFLLTTVFPGIASNSPTATVFGPVIALLFFFNLVAQLVLFTAAWIATAPGLTGNESLDDDGPGDIEGLEYFGRGTSLDEMPPGVPVAKPVSTSTAATLVGVGAGAAAVVGWWSGLFRRR